MRNLILTALLLLSVAACKQNRPADQAAVTAGPVMVEMSITGMSCIGCVETVRSSIAQLDGIDTVMVSLDKANAIITFSPGKTDSLTIRKAVELNGYKVTETKKMEVVR